MKKPSLAAIRNLPKRKLALFSVAAIVVVAAAVAGGLFGYNKYQESKKPKVDTSAESIQSAAEGIAEDKDYDAAIAQLKKAQKDAPTTEGRRNSAVALGAAYAQKGNHSEALTAYQEAERHEGEKDPNVLLGIATEAEATGNKGLAKDYFTKARDVYATLEANESNKAVIAHLEAKIASL